ncbi:MAG: SHOCT domain-containing protein, partial [Spirochaetia bacterium]|nr:SHOCT domain-containing protein [Spirochaetia bacterium]
VQKDITAELEKLASLKEKGILSDEEFAAQKAKLLGL